MQEARWFNHVSGNLVLPPLSYTFLRNYENCPKKALHLNVLKDAKRIGDVKRDFGTDVHKDMDHRLAKGPKVYPLKGTSAPMEHFAATLEATAKAHNLTIKTEQGIGVSTHFIEVDFWKGENLWLRTKPDVTLINADRTVCVTWDWKTGKPRYAEDFELGLQCIGLMARYRNLKVVKAGFVFTQTETWGELKDFSDKTRTLEQIERSTRRMEAGDWEATPNFLCKWCDVLQCAHNRRHELEEE